MRNLITILFSCLLQNSFATNYYISTSGSDANNGTSTSTPWQNLSKVNSRTFSAGDSIFFKAGEWWTGTLRINQAGASGNPIYIGAYGTGAKPEINGEKDASGAGWTSMGGGVYKSTVALSSNVNVVRVNDTARNMGRYPNTGMLTYTAKNSSSIIYHTLSTAYNGAELIMRYSPWQLGRDTITTISNDTINFKNSLGSNPNTGYGFFVQNNVNTLDTLYEWYYDGADLYMYFGAKDPNLQSVVSTSTDTLMVINNNYVVVNGLSFSTANVIGVYQSGANSSIVNCDFKNIGGYGIYTGYGDNYISIIHCNFDNCYNNAIRFNGANNYAKVTSNTILNTNKFIGSGYALSGLFDTWADAVIFTSGNYGLFDSNYVYGVGHTGVRFSSQYDTVRYNVIGDYGKSRGDVGAIYAWKSDRDITGAYIYKNIILPSYGNKDGMLSNEPDSYTSGIYLDGTNNGSIIGNTISGVANGILLNWNQGVTIYGNTIYDSKAMGIIASEGNQAMTGMSIKNNIIVGKRNMIAYYNLGITVQPVNMGCMSFRSSLSSTMPNIGVLDSNYYARPIDNNLLFNTFMVGDGWYGTRRSFSSWKTFTGYDANSINSPYTITDTSQIKIVYNTNSSAQVFPLSYIYTDMKGTVYNSGSITIQPFTSAVLVVTGDLPVPPVGSSVQYFGTLKLVTN